MPVHGAAALLMVPTQVWVTIAAKLNYDITMLNSPHSGKALEIAAMFGNEYNCADNESKQDVLSLTYHTKVLQQD